MGSLHKGHLSLIERALSENQKVIVSIYVNPTQFNNKNDLKKYPRDLEKDLRMLSRYENILIYTPKTSDIYKEGEKSNQYNFGEFINIMEGKERPGHFDGVATIIEKLFKVFHPNNAYFGEKDFQQLILIKMLVEKLKLKINVIGCKTIREPDGLAMSSRNKLMNKEERKTAGLIFQLLSIAKEMYQKHTTMQIKNEIQKQVQFIDNFDLEYFEIINLKKDLNISLDNKESRAFLACKIGKVRLIDNLNLI